TLAPMRLAVECDPDGEPRDPAESGSPWRQKTEQAPDGRARNRDMGDALLIGERPLGFGAAPELVHGEDEPAGSERPEVTAREGLRRPRKRHGHHGDLGLIAARQALARAWCASRPEGPDRAGPRASPKHWPRR